MAFKLGNPGCCCGGCFNQSIAPKINDDPNVWSMSNVGSVLKIGVYSVIIGTDTDGNGGVYFDTDGPSRDRVFQIKDADDDSVLHEVELDNTRSVLIGTFVVPEVDLTIRRNETDYTISILHRDTGAQYTDLKLLDYPIPSPNFKGKDVATPNFRLSTLGTESVSSTQFIRCAVKPPSIATNSYTWEPKNFRLHLNDYEPLTLKYNVEWYEFEYEYSSPSSLPSSTQILGTNGTYESSHLPFVEYHIKTRVTDDDDEHLLYYDLLIEEYVFENMDFSWPIKNSTIGGSEWYSAPYYDGDIKWKTVDIYTLHPTLTLSRSWIPRLAEKDSFVNFEDPLDFDNECTCINFDPLGIFFASGGIVSNPTNRDDNTIDRTDDLTINQGGPLWAFNQIEGRRYFFSSFWDVRLTSPYFLWDVRVEWYE